MAQSLKETNTESSSLRTHTPDVSSESPEEKISATFGDANRNTETLAVAEVKEHEYVTGVKLLVVLIAVTIVVFLMMLDLSIVVTAYPRITSDFHSLGDIGWYGSAYLLSSCALQPSTGKIYTYFSSKWTFLSFLFLFELGSLLCGVSNSSNMLIVGRSVAGMGGSGLVNGALTILSACVPLHKRPFYLGILMSISQLGVLLGPLIGGALTEYTTWRWCFYINLPIGALVAVFLLLIAIPDRTVKTNQSALSIIREKIDIIGFLIFAPAIIQFLLALQWGGVTYAWSSATIIGLFCGAAGTFAIFLYWEYRAGDDAMIPLSMIRVRVVWVSAVVIFFFMGNMLLTTYYLPIYFQTVRDATPTMSGVYVLPTVISQMIAAVGSGALVAKLGYVTPFILASGALAAIASGLFTTLTLTTTTGIWIGYQIIGGFGRGLGMQMPIVATQNALAQEQLPTAMAVIIFFQTFGGALFVSFAQTTFNSGLIKALAEYAPELDSEYVIHLGATAIRGAIPAASLPGVINAYNKAINDVFYMALACTIIYWCAAWGVGWKSIKKVNVVAPEA